MALPKTNEDVLPAFQREVSRQVPTMEKQSIKQIIIKRIGWVPMHNPASASSAHDNKSSEEEIPQFRGFLSWAPPLCVSEISRRRQQHPSK